MRQHQKKDEAERNRTSPARLKFAVGGLIVVLAVALPQILGAHPTAAANPAGFLFTVTTLDDHNDFVCDGTDCTLREAIQAANNAPTDDTIDFSVTGTINLLSELPDISDSVTIDGPGSAMLTVKRNSTNFFRIFNVTTTGTVTLNGLRITFGVAPTTPVSFGGGIQNASTGTLNVINSTITENAALFGSAISNSSTGTVNLTNSLVTEHKFNSAGSAIYNRSGIVTLTNSTVSDNADRAVKIGGGGAIYNDAFPGGPGVVNIINSTVTNNTTIGGGGAIFNQINGAVNITNSTLSVNVASDVGGAIDNRGGTVTVSNCTISGNRSQGGGAFYLTGGTLNITNSTISSNLVSSTQLGYGGGIFLDSCCGTVNLTNSTITGNVASGNTSLSHGKGGGIANVNAFDPNGTPGTFNVRSSIIALNNATSDGPEGVGPFTSAGFNLIGRADSSTVGFTKATDIVGTIFTPLEPGLDPNGLQDNGGSTKTIALVCGSPAIDRGTADSLIGNLFTDQRGDAFPRIIDDPFKPNASDGTDIGAFELTVCNHPPVAQCRNIQVPADSSCHATITAAQIDNGSFDPDPGDSIVNRTLDNYGPFALGPHTVTLSVTDNHGAFGSCTATVTVVDTTPPMITCPANITAKAQPGGTCVVVNYAPPQATDNCGLMSVTCTPPSGSCFPLGSTSVTCTAKDNSGNTASCSLSVTTFDICLQDDSNGGTVFLGNSATGDYRFCCSGMTFTGRAQVTRRGLVFTFQDYATDRRVLATDDEGVFRGTASLQSPVGVTKCGITDRDTRNNGCSCQ